jgi:ATP phosphoribosyltransferase regulatory subunit
MTRRTLLEIPSGVQCFFGPEARLRRDVERVVVDVFRGWSYEEIVLPLFDFDDVFHRGNGGGDSGIYRFVGRDGEVLALRPDFTALTAKAVVSRLSRFPLPLRLFYSGEVLRYQPPRAGQREELFQIGLERVGGDSVEADVETLLVALEALDRLGISEPILTLGHVGLALGLLSESTETERHAALEAMRHRDRQTIRNVLGLERAAQWSELSRLSGEIDVLSEAREMAAAAPARAAVDRLSRVAAFLKDLGLGSRLRVDLGEVRGFEYYTGLVFEIHAPGAPLELGGGGRYDSLVARFGRDVPAIGFYLSLDRLAELLASRGFARPEGAIADLDPGRAPSDTFRAALEARRAGKRVRLLR